MRRHGTRVYLKRDHDGPPVPGGTRFRGTIELDACGAHVDRECEMLVPGGEWSPVKIAKLIPWHRIDLVEFSGPARITSGKSAPGFRTVGA
jgi:hypothetical protein